MSFGQRPQVTENDPYKNMPDWVKVYYQNQIANAGQSDNRADALRMMFSGFTQPEYDFVHGHRSTGPAAPAQGNATADALARLVGGAGGNPQPASSGGSDDAMWSDGMTGSEIREHQAAGTFGAAPRDTRSAYDRQMDSYTRSGGGISVGGGRTPAEALASVWSR